MKRTIIASALVAATWFGLISTSQAQVFIRAPFVRVAVGDGVAVRAPFVNVWVPGDGPNPIPPYGPRVIYMPPPIVVQPQPGQPVQPQPFVPPAPQPIKPEFKDDAPPAPVQPAEAPTLQAFAKSFQAKAGSYELSLQNPVTKQPTTVRFMLPDGTPKRVDVRQNSIEFFYRLGHWVRIEFDRDGAQVTSRGN